MNYLPKKYLGCIPLSNDDVLRSRSDVTIIIEWKIEKNMILRKKLNKV